MIMPYNNSYAALMLQMGPIFRYFKSPNLGKHSYIICLNIILYYYFIIELSTKFWGFPIYAVCITLYMAEDGIAEIADATLIS